MERASTFILAIGAVLATSGCNDGGAATGSGGTGGQPGTAALDPLDGIPRYAVVSSDFSSSSIAVLDESFAVLDESWVSSGTTYPGLVATLSGDVVLPSKQAGDGTLTVIDRFFTDVITRFYLPSGNLNGQVRTQVDAGYSSNPQDFVFVGPQSAWATRYEPNLDPSALPQNQGNDLIEVNPTEMTLTGARIDLSSLNTMVDASDGGTTAVEVFARPGRARLIGTRIIVGLDRVSASFDAAGPGMVAVVDLEDESVEGVELSGLKNCGNVGRVPGAPTKVVVACAGFSQPFGDEAQIRASSGIAVLDASERVVQVELLWRVADHPDAPVPVGNVVALDEQRVLGVANGDFATVVDTLQMVDLVMGEQAAVYESTDSFVIGLSAYDPESEMVFVPDAAADAVIELALDGGDLVPVGSQEIAPELGLPPTQAYLLD